MDILNDILACVSVALDGLFPDTKVFTELVPDELPERCFLLGYAGEADIKHALGSRYEISGKLDIAYIVPKKGESFKSESNEVFAAISLGLRHLAYDGVKIRLGEHRRQDTDGVLHDICAFKTFLYRTNDFPYMGKINVYPAIKE